MWWMLMWCEGCEMEDMNAMMRWLLGLSLALALSTIPTACAPEPSLPSVSEQQAAEQAWQAIYGQMSDREKLRGDAEVGDAD